MKHYYKIVFKIFTTSYSYSKVLLLFCYFRLIVKSYAFHKRKQDETSLILSELTEKVLDYTVHFSHYPQLIDLFEEIFIYQVYEFKSTKPHPIILDCGSNIGLSILYFKKVYPSCRIMAFEPDHEAHALLEKNILINDLSFVTLSDFALSDTEGEATLYNKKYSADSLTLSLLNSPDKTPKTKVFTRRLSTFIQDEVDFIKVDVEGSEIEIINDLVKSKKIDLIEKMIIEFHPLITKVSVEQFVETICQNNYQCKYYQDKLHPGATDFIVHWTNQK